MYRFTDLNLIADPVNIIIRGCIVIWVTKAEWEWVSELSDRVSDWVNEWVSEWMRDWVEWLSQWVEW